MHTALRSETSTAKALAVLLVAYGTVAHGQSWPGGTVPTLDGSPNAIAIAAGALYVAGYDAVPGNGQWRLERRLLDSGALDVSFGGTGIATGNPTFNWDIANDVATDATHAYLVGQDGAGGFGSQRWRIEKRRLADGALEPGFGTGGVVTLEPSSGAASVALVACDLLVAGDSWRIERRRLEDGGLVDSFGDGGAVTVGGGAVLAMTLHGEALYVGGTANYTDWRIERRDPATGALVWGVVEGFPDVGCGGQGVFALAADADGLYLAGEASGQWRVERRRLTDGGLAYAHALPGSGGCDAPQGIAIDEAAMYLAGRMSIKSRIEKRLLVDGALDPTFGTGGIAGGTDVEPTGMVLDRGLLYVAGTQFGPIAGTNGSVERRRASDGGLAAGAVTTTTVVTAPTSTTTQLACPSTPTTTITPATTTTTTLPACRAPLELKSCRVRAKHRKAARDRLTLRCVVQLAADSNGLDPSTEGIRFSLTRADSAVCTSPLVLQTVMPRRRGGCWRYTARQEAGGLRRLELCEMKPAQDRYRLTARIRQDDLPCPNGSSTCTVDLAVGDDCSVACDGETTTTTPPTSTTSTTTASTTTTTIVGAGCHAVSAFPTVAANAMPPGEDWLAPQDALVSDQRTAFVRVSNAPSNFLVVTGFGFALPATARIEGISLRVVRAARDPGNIVDDGIRLLKGGTILPTDRSGFEAWTPFYTAIDYGGPTDGWGTTWTPAEIGNPGFGAALRVRYTDFAGNGDAGVDSMRVTVHYCE